MVLGDGIRRNVAEVTPEERTRLKNAIIALHTSFHYPGKRSDKPVGGVSYWFKQDEIHANSHVHNCPAFIPWHREMINRFEDLLTLRARAPSIVEKSAVACGRLRQSPAARPA